MLLDCNYPLKIIKKGIHNAKLQGPAPPPKNKNNTLPFVTTYYSNCSHQFSTHQINNQLTTVKDKERIKTVCMYIYIKLYLEIQKPYWR